MKSKIIQNINKAFCSTGKKCPVGSIADKITPNNRKGHIIGIIVSVPDNPISENFLTLLMLGSPVVTDHSAKGLAQGMLSCARDFGVEENQIEGIGVDGQYIHLGVKKQLMKLMDVNNILSTDDLNKWVTAIWEPSHNINLADHDISEMQVFSWLTGIINIVASISSSLNIGKSAEDLHQALYKLQPFSNTRFARYSHVSYLNFQRSYAIIVDSLRKRKGFADTKVKNLSKKHLNSICNISFVSTLCG